MFHTHCFLVSDKDPEMLYCHCGAVKDIHRHIWDIHATITDKYPFRISSERRITGYIMRCRVCGELKTVDDLY